jgi:hypothetical protein
MKIRPYECKELQNENSIDEELDEGATNARRRLEC